MKTNDLKTLRLYDLFHVYTKKPFFFIVAYFIILQTLLVIWDSGNPGIFMNADRANTRFVAMESVLSAIRTPGKDILNSLSSHGIIGDYFFHAVLFGLGGKPLVLFVQITLAGLSVAMLYGLSYMILYNLTSTVAITLIYMHLPYSLIYPHMLTSEAFFTPLLLLSIGFLAVYLLKGGQILFLIGAALLIGICSIIRPIAILLPIIIAGIAYFYTRAQMKNHVIYVFISIAPLLIWMSIILYATGEFSMGRSGHDLSHNLFNRANIILRAANQKGLPDIKKDLPVDQSAPGNFTLSDYIAVVASNPGVAFQHYKNDLITFIAKSGVEAVLLDYFNFYPELKLRIRKPHNTWRRDIDKHGMIYVIQAIFKRQPVLMVAAICGSIFFMVLWAGYVMFIWRLILDRKKLKPHYVALMVILYLLPPYVFATSTIANNVHSRHRAPAEFCIVLLGIAGLRGMKRQQPNNGVDGHYQPGHDK